MDSSKRDYRQQYDQRARQIVSEMDLEEKVHLMSGRVTMEELLADVQHPDRHYNWYPYPAGGHEGLGVPALKFCDGPRGVVCGHGSTCFPVSMARGASFDTALEEEIGGAIGREVRAYGGNFFGGVCVNIPYNPGWGRSQEVYGEDPHHMGSMGSALVKGVQSHNVVACVKHYAFNSMEIARFKVSVECNKRTEQEVFLPHFKDCIDAGAGSVMSAYNRYQGVYCGHNHYLLEEVLRKTWNFDGFVISDFIWGIRDTAAAANAGMDVEMCITRFYGPALIAAVRKGQVSEDVIDRSARRIVRTLLAFDEAEDPMEYGKDLIGCSEHAALAQRSAEESITLIKNQGQVLPLAADVQSIAVIGRLAEAENLGDHGSSRVFPNHVVTPLEGLCQRLPDADILFCDGSDLEQAKRMARSADAVVFVVGYDHADEGEYVSGDQMENYTQSIGGDRVDSLGLHQEDIDLIEAVAPENDAAVAVLIGGSMIMTQPWDAYVRAIVMAYYPGQAGGTALARILLGDVNPSGKLPFVVPFDEGHLPQVDWNADEQWYDYYHGYKKLDKEGIQPMYHYGHGLSYTSFALSDCAVSVQEGQLTATVQVENTGSRPGAEVVQLYVAMPDSQVDRPEKALKGFCRVELEPGFAERIRMACPLAKLAYFDEGSDSWQLETGRYTAYIGTSSDPAVLTEVAFVL